MRKTYVVACCALVFALSACTSEPPPTGHLTPAGAGPAGYGLFHDVSTLAAVAGVAVEGKPCKFTMDATADGKSLKESGQGEFDGVKTEISLKVLLDDQQIELLMIDTGMYMKLPPGSPKSGPIAWLRIPTDGSGSADAKAFSDSEIQLTNQEDPVKLLARIGKAGSISHAERTTLAGRPVGHYTISLAFARMLDDYPVSADAKRSVIAADIHFVLDLWVDSGEHPVRAMLDATSLAKIGGSSTPAKMTVDYTDWDTPVSVQTPPADQVGDFH